MHRQRFIRELAGMATGRTAFAAMASWHGCVRQDHLRHLFATRSKGNVMVLPIAFSTISAIVGRLIAPKPSVASGASTPVGFVKIDGSRRCTRPIRTNARPANGLQVLAFERTCVERHLRCRCQRSSNAVL